MYGTEYLHLLTCSEEITHCSDFNRMILSMLCDGKVTDRMLSERFQTVLLLVFLLFSLACATANATEEEPPPCSKPLKTQTSSSDADDNDGDGDGNGLPPQEEPPCIPPLEFEPTEEQEPADDGTEPTQLSLDQDDDDGTNVTALAGKCTSSSTSKRRHMSFGDRL